MRERAESARQALRRHPWAIALMSTRTSPRPRTTRVPPPPTTGPTTTTLPPWIAGFLAQSASFVTPTMALYWATSNAPTARAWPCGTPLIGAPAGRRYRLRAYAARPRLRRVARSALRQCPGRLGLRRRHVGHPRWGQALPGSQPGRPGGGTVSPGRSWATAIVFHDEGAGMSDLAFVGPECCAFIHGPAYVAMTFLSLPGPRAGLGK
jgi:hypothetical protein